MIQMSITNSMPSSCPKHKIQMYLQFYERPGSPPGNGWVCRECYNERKSREEGSLEHQPTRFPGGAEL